VIDWERIEQLERDFGTECLTEVIHMFFSEAEEVIAPLRRGDARRDLRSDMHFLKGSALNLGFRQLASLCSEAEQLAARGRRSEVGIAEILGAYDAARGAILNRKPAA